MADDLTPEQQEALARLAKLSVRWRRADEAAKTATDELHAGIIEALRLDIRPKDIDDVVPYDRNHVRRIGAKAGIPARKEPTVQPRTKG